MPIVSALVAASVTVSLWLAQQNKERAKAHSIALSTFAYFTHGLAEALRHPADQMGHIDMAVLNEHLPALMAEKDFNTALHEVHERYLKWRLGSYLNLPSDSPELERQQRLLKQHELNANEELRKRARR